MHSRLSVARTFGGRSIRAIASGSLLLGAALTFAACSGGGTSTSDARVNSLCSGSAADFVCLEACSLGCRTSNSSNASSVIACEITDIAQNENIVLRFSQPIDPRFVDTSTIQFRTASGAEPVGQFLVNGNIVEFKPQVLTQGSQSFFGFQAGESYTMLIPVGGQNTLRSTAGDPLLNAVSCTLRVTRGIIDLNGVAPSAELVQPTLLEEVPLDSVIQLRFNELIDATPFIGAVGSNAPVSFSVARTLNQGGTRICSPEVTQIAGSVRVDQVAAISASVVTFTPAASLPTNSCVRVSVTSRVQDLSGRPAEPQVFEFRTLQAALTERSVVEEFDNADFLDANASAGTWEGGLATFAQVGGDGRHGPFSLALATQLPNQGALRVFELNTNNTVIPAASTVGGAPLTVTDGKFQFTEMVLPSDVKLVFSGTATPQIAVRGPLQIDGVIDVSGESLLYFESANLSALPGQPGGRGGIGGANGGAGGTRCIGAGALPANAGQNGFDARVPSGHAYAAQVANTGGRGSGVFPATGLRTSLVFPPASSFTDYVMQTTSGGGGGGLVALGGQGRAVSNQADPSGNGQTRTDFLGSPSAGGTSAPFYTVPVGAQSLLHYQVGGSGGGGAGSHAALMNKTLALAPTGNWAPGSGGGGGGGVIALRAGRQLRINSLARILASGGSAGTSPATQTAVAQSAPGGGGSGGSILLQSAGTVEITGTVDVRGGAAGRLSRGTLPSAPPHGGTVLVEGGAGSPGILRLEALGSPTVSLLPNAQPAATVDNVGPLADTDTRVAFQSTFYSTGQPFGPEFVRYEIRARINGQPVVFSDDPSVGAPARPGFGPLEVWWQGVRLDLETGAIDQVDLLTRQWRPSVGFGPGSLALDNRNAFRFQLILDRTSVTDVVIESVKVIYRV